MGGSGFTRVLFAGALIGLWGLSSVVAQAQVEPKDDQESPAEAATPEPARSGSHARRPARLGVADLRVQLARLDARDEQLIKQRTNPTLFWPILGTLAGFSLGTVFMPAGIGAVVSNQPASHVEGSPGSGAGRSLGLLFVGVGAAALLAGTVCAWRIRKIKRGRAEREREFQAIGRRRNELQLELYTASQP